MTCSDSECNADEKHQLQDDKACKPASQTAKHKIITAEDCAYVAHRQQRLVKKQQHSQKREQHSECGQTESNLYGRKATAVTLAAPGGCRGESTLTLAIARP